MRLARIALDSAEWLPPVEQSERLVYMAMLGFLKDGLIAALERVLAES